MYTCSVVSESFRIFPKNKKNETIVIPVVRTVFTLRHRSGEEITFRRSFHRGEWKWSDSRIKGTVSQEYVIEEMARMMFRGDVNQAIDLVIQNLMAA